MRGVWSLSVMAQPFVSQGAEPLANVKGTTEPFIDHERGFGRASGTGLDK